MTKCPRCLEEKDGTEFHDRNVGNRRQPYCKECMKRYQNEKRLAYKAKVFALFGSKCARCGFSDIRALQIDHIHGNGYIERGGKNRNNVSQVYRDILRMSEGERNAKYQLLCANCNWIKKFENGEVGGL